MIARAICVAGGSGIRMGVDTPKQLLPVGSSTILERAVQPFLACVSIESVTIVSARSIMEEIAKLYDGDAGEDISIVEGGGNRQESVYKGLVSLPDDTDIVVVHDAVRPFITTALIEQCVVAANISGAVTVMVPVKDTIKEVRDGRVVSTLDRAALWATQTPQAFRRETLVRAHEKALEDSLVGTDDAMLVERMGDTVTVIEGNDINIKITTPADLAIAGVLSNLLESE